MKSCLAINYSKILNLEKLEYGIIRLKYLKNVINYFF